MLKSNNNLDKIVEYFEKDNLNCLFLNYLDEGKQVFYLFLIKFFSQKYNYTSSLGSSIAVNDLFSNKKNIQLLLKPNANEIKSALDTNTKNIIICDYRLYLNYSKKYLTINAYNFKKDLIYFFKKYFDIDNQSLLDGLVDSPQYLFSEIEKYSINPSGYKFDIYDIAETNFIAELRKKYYENKNNKFDLSNLFNHLKLETLYKKFNFLTY